MTAPRPEKASPEIRSRQPPGEQPPREAETRPPACDPPDAEENSPLGSGRAAAEPEPQAISFGEVTTGPRESPTGTAARLPAEDGHIRVLPVERPGASAATSAPTDVYVHLDVMLAMQEHAAEDTSVELGGVLVGQRGRHADGNWYVVIRDALRARHYRATRGSFTFTHETWSDLRARQAALPDESQMVGWYHTHPGWGVFLSSMDVFICDHFFADPDDVALVIDPTSGDTGLFVRRGAEQQPAPLRLPRYYLFAHRHREAELQGWAAYFSGGETMSQPNAVFPQRQGAPLVVAPPQQPAQPWERWLPLLVVAVLAGQLLLTAALASRLWSPGSAPPAPATSDTLAAREAIVDQILDDLVEQGGTAVQASYRRLASEAAALRTSNAALAERVETLRGELRGTQAKLRADAEAAARTERQLAAAESQLAKLNPTEGAIAGLRVFGMEWVALVVGATVGMLVAGLAGAAAWWFRNRQSAMSTE
jgi:proteasome lid subunit RPN8/RPN11